MKVHLYEVVMCCDPFLRKCMATEHGYDPELMEVLYTPMLFVQEAWVTVPRRCVMIIKLLGEVTVNDN